MTTRKTLRTTGEEPTPRPARTVPPPPSMSATLSPPPLPSREQRRAASAPAPTVKELAEEIDALRTELANVRAEMAILRAVVSQRGGGGPYRGIDGSK